MSGKEELRGEALRQAWLDAGYRVQGLDDPMPEPTVSVRALAMTSAVAISLAVVCWAIIGAGVWLVWRLF